MPRTRSKVRVKRVYDDPEWDDGFRVLVDRLWPRGLSRERAAVDLWLKEVAPSTELRRWYHAHLERWDEFRKRYESELERGRALGELRAVVREHSKDGGVTLVFGSRDVEHNHALVLRDALSGGGAKRQGGSLASFPPRAP